MSCHGADGTSLELNTQTSIAPRPSNGIGERIELINGEAMINRGMELAQALTVIASDGSMNARFNVSQSVPPATKKGGAFVQQKDNTMTISLRPILPLAAALTLSFASVGYAAEIFTTNGVAINGYDPVAYFTNHRPVKGSDKYMATYKGATFHFASAAHRDAFAANPRRFAPQYGGYCAFGTAQGHKASTEPQAFTVVDNKLYLNYNDSVLKTWRQDVSGYIKKAEANWEKVKVQPDP